MRWIVVKMMQPSSAYDMHIQVLKDAAEDAEYEEVIESPKKLKDNGDD